MEEDEDKLFATHVGLSRLWKYRGCDLAHEAERSKSVYRTSSEIRPSTVAQ